MSKFISSAVNYSETTLLKTKILSIILESYNQEILLNNSVKLNLDTSSKYFIPNNDVKYYMLIVNKNDITSNNTNNKYKICYFFTNKQSNIHTDFYVEIDNHKTNFTKNNYLFEGYLYSNTFLISDILAIDSKIITCDYSLRYSLINKIITNQNLNNLNGHLNINIHSIFQINDNDNSNVNDIFNIFKNNFVFKNDIKSIEYVYEKSLQKNQQNIFIESENSKQLKNISRTKYIDVYNVKNINNNDIEGILYIKTISDSKKLYSLLSNNDTIVLTCIFNQVFKKWQVLF
jgi:hypothetical protein